MTGSRLSSVARATPAQGSGHGLVGHTTVFAPPPSRTTRIAARVPLALQRCSFGLAGRRRRLLAPQKSSQPQRPGRVARRTLLAPEYMGASPQALLWLLVRATSSL